MHVFTSSDKVEVWWKVDAILEDGRVGVHGVSAPDSESTHNRTGRDVRAGRIADLDTAPTCPQDDIMVPIADGGSSKRSA